MMRAGSLGVAALFVGALGAHFLLQDTGYVLISLRSYVIEMSVPVLVLLLAAAYALVRALLRIWRAPRRLGAALAERRHRRAGAKLTRALIHLTEGDWRRGERLLTQASSGTDTPLVNYLIAARAAQLQGSRERRDEWLALARRSTPGAESAVLLAQAELQIEAGEHEAARAALERMRREQPDHPVALALLARTCRALGDRAALVELLPKLGGARLAAGELDALAALALEHGYAEPDLTRERIDTLWAALPAGARKRPALIRLRALALDSIRHGGDAESELRAALRRHWAAELVRTYGEVTGADPARQLRQAEKWLETHAEDATLLFTAARLSIANELWGKARSYYESGLALAPEAAAYARYGELLEQLGRPDEAAQAFQSGLRLASGTPRGLPALNPPPRAAGTG